MLSAGRIFDLHTKRNQTRDAFDETKAKLFLTSEVQYQKKAKMLERKLTKLTSRMAALRSRKDYKAVAVFVTFEADTTADAVIDEFKGIIPRKGTLFRKYHRLKVSRAPEPDVILWENLQHRGIESVIRSALVTLISAILLLASFVTIIFTTGNKYPRVHPTQHKAGCVEFTTLFLLYLAAFKLVLTTISYENQIFSLV